MKVLTSVLHAHRTQTLLQLLFFGGGGGLFMVNDLYFVGGRG